MSDYNREMQLCKLLLEHKDEKVFNIKLPNKEKFESQSFDDGEDREFKFVEGLQKFESKLLSKEEVKSKLGRKWKKCFSNMNKLLPQFKYMKKVGESYQIAFPAKLMEEQYSLTQKELSRVIASLKQVGVLRLCNKPSYVECVCGIYEVNVKQLYVVENEVVYEMKKQVRELKKQLREDKLKELYPIQGDTFGEYASKVRISSNLRLPKKLSDQQVQAALLENYPFLEQAYQDVEEANKHLVDELKIKLQPKIKRSKHYITHIGIRCSNSKVSMKTEENEKKDQKIDEDYFARTGQRRERVKKEIKEQYFKKHFGDVKIYKYDFKSSIYRVTYFLNTGIWLPRNFDLYEQIAGYSWSSKEEKQPFKYTLMLLYFTSSAKKVVSNNSAILEKYNFSKDEALAILESIKQRMLKTIGKLYGSEVFLYESYIYLQLYKELVKKYDVVQIYDEFDSNVELEDEVQKLLDEKVNVQLRDMLMNNIESQSLPHFTSQRVCRQADTSRASRVVVNEVNKVVNEVKDKELKVKVKEVKSKSNESKQEEVKQQSYIQYRETHSLFFQKPLPAAQNQAQSLKQNPNTYNRTMKITPVLIQAYINKSILDYDTAMGLGNNIQQLRHCCISTINNGFNEQNLNYTKAKAKYQLYRDLVQQIKLEMLTLVNPNFFKDLQLRERASYNIAITLGKNKDEKGIQPTIKVDNDIPLPKEKPVEQLFDENID